MLRSRTILFLVISFFGFSLLLWSASDWFSLMDGQRVGKSFCNISAYWNCDIATMSPFGSFMNFPTGLFGAFWFVVLALLTLASKKSTRKIQMAARFWMMLGVIAVATLGSYLFFELKTGCPTCAISYVLVLAAVGLAWRDLRNERSVVSLKTALILVAIISLGLFAYGSFKRSQLDRAVPEDEFNRWFMSLEQTTVPVVSPLTKGDSEAPITVVEFSDFGCPHCARAAQTLVPYMAKEKDVRVVFYSYPLDGSCNRLTPGANHRNSCQWTRVAICAERQNRFWPVHDEIFQHTASGRPLPPVEEALGNFDVNQDQLKLCLQNPETEATLQQMIDVAEKLEISSTPTFFINGYKVQGAIPVPLARRLIQKLREP